MGRQERDHFTTNFLTQDTRSNSRLRGRCPHPRAPGALALSLDRGCRFSLFSAKPCTPMLNFFARSGRKIEKIDSLWTGRGIWKGEGKAPRLDFFAFLNTLLGDEFNDAIEGFADFGRVTAARLREVGTPAARATHNRGNLLDNVAGFDPRRQVGGHRDDQRGLALTEVRANCDDGGTVLLPQPVGHFAQPSRLDSVDFTCDDLDAVLLAHLLLVSTCCARNELLFECAELLFEFLFACEQAF